MNNHTLWRLAGQTLAAIARHCAPVQERIVAQSGLEGRTWGGLIAALTFEPETTTAARFLVRGPYAAAESYQSRLPPAVVKDYLAEVVPGEYRLTDAGRAATDRCISDLRAVMVAADPLGQPDSARLSGLLARLVQDSLDAPPPPQTWSVALAHKLMPAAEPPLPYIEQAISCLNAYRDDCHLAAWLTPSPPDGGVGGCLSATALEALTLLWRGEADSLEALCGKLAHRGHPRQVYAQALAELRARGYLEGSDDSPRVTASGAAFCQQVEDDTDRYFFAPWSCLTGAEKSALAGLLRRLRDGLNADLSRPRLLSHLSAERARLLEKLVSLDEQTLSEKPVFADWTAKDILAHIAAWDDNHGQDVQLILDGREGQVLARDTHAVNAALQAERRGWSLEDAFAACLSARDNFLALLSAISDEQLHRMHAFSFGQAAIYRWAIRRARHDGAHAADLAVWRKGLPEGIGPKSIMLVALVAGRDELLAAAALISPEERETRPVCGVWTLKDTLGHVTDWERYFVEGLRRMAAGQPPDMEKVGDFDAWNQAHAQARQGQSWETVWADLQAARQELLAILNTMSQAELSRSYPGVWEPETTPYSWALVLLYHERDHAQTVRDSCA